MKPPFKNPWPHEMHGLMDILKWKLGLGPHEAPELPEAPNQAALWQRVTREHIAVPPARGWRAVWLGHASFLLQGNGRPLLVDPVFSNFCGPLPLPLLRRQVPCPCTLKELPPIDGKVAMDYQNFNLPVVRAMLVMTVDPKLVVGFHLVGRVK